MADPSKHVESSTLSELTKSVGESRREHAKLRYDWYKHQTTLSTGSILVIAALLGSLFPNYDSMWLIIISFISLLLSTVTSFAAMGFLIDSSEREDLSWTMGRPTLGIENKVQDKQIARFEKVSMWVGRVGSASLVVGIFSFCAFVLYNSGNF
jgi:hypothetical protein